jgi:hypothetical protein
LAAYNRHTAIISLIKSEQQRIKFVSIINVYVEYDLYRSVIYQKCYPTDNIKFPEPITGWDVAYRVTEKYYYDEIFFYLHMYVASRVDSRECNSNRERLASSSNRTYELMNVLTSKLKEYINLDVSKLLLE